LTGSPAAGSALLAALTIAAAVGGPLFGVLLDRSPRPDRVLALTLAAYAVGVIAIAATVGRLPVSLVVLIALAAGLFNPAVAGGWTSQLPRIVTGPALSRGFALDAMTYSVASLAGPALAALVAAGLGARTAVIVAAALVALAVPSARSLSRYPPAPSAATSHRRAAPRPGPYRQVAAGFAAIATRRPLLRATVTSVVSYAGIGMLLVSCPVLGAQRLGGPARGALLISAIAAASLVANSVLARRQRRPDQHRRPPRGQISTAAEGGQTSTAVPAGGTHRTSGGYRGPFGRKIVRMSGCDAYRVPSGGRPVRTAHFHHAWGRLDGRPFFMLARPVRPDPTDRTMTMSTGLARRRSAELEELIHRDASRFRILTGDRPTGQLHLGHYFGTLRNRVRLQDLGAEVFVLIADYQVLTDRDNAEHLDEYVTSLVLDYLAIGLDPARTVVFAHSAVPALNQLLLPFLSLVSVPELQRNPTVKDEIAHSRQSAVSGLMLTYPVHQAADILFCKANLVPVGQDQLPHLEITRIIARRFNTRYGTPVFPVPDALLSAAPLLLGTDGTKMSKSRGNAIALAATADETARLIRGAKTDAERYVSYDPERRPEVSNLVLLAALALGRSPQDVVADLGTGGAAALKDTVTMAVNELLAPVRARRAEYARDLGYVRQVLREGNERADAIAAATLDEVRAAMGMRY
jgi:tryptophanyl-tRNA synthetase